MSQIGLNIGDRDLDLQDQIGFQTYYATPCEGDNF